VRYIYKNEICDAIVSAPSVRGVKKWVTEAMRLGPGRTWNQKAVQEVAKHRISTLRKGRPGRAGHAQNDKDMSW